MPKIRFTVEITGRTVEACGDAFEDIATYADNVANNSDPRVRVTVSEPDYAVADARPMAKVFCSLESRTGVVPGWYYSIDLTAPVGPFLTKRQATKACQEART